MDDDSRNLTSSHGNPSSSHLRPPTPEGLEAEEAVARAIYADWYDKYGTILDNQLIVARAAIDAYESTRPSALTPEQREAVEWALLFVPRVEDYPDLRPDWHAHTRRLTAALRSLLDSGLEDG